MVHESPPLACFKARIVRGAGRGGRLHAPTLNLDLRDVPKAIPDGIYAGWVIIAGTKHPAAIHSGPKPFYREGRSFEAHVIDEEIPSTPETLTIELVKRLRDITDFPSESHLMQQIAADISAVRSCLSAPK